jgi:hypothetical protein
VQSQLTALRVYFRVYVNNTGKRFGMIQVGPPQRETEPSSEDDPLKQALTFPTRESKIASDPKSLDLLLCIFLSCRGLRDLLVFVSQKGGIK